MSNKKLKLVTLRVLVDASSRDKAFDLLDGALLGSSVGDIEYLACADAPENVFAAVGQGMDVLETARQNTPVDIPFGLDYRMVDSRDGGLVGETNGVNSAWIGITDPVISSDANVAELSLFVQRTASGVIVDMSGPDVDDVLSSSTALFADAKPAEMAVTA